MNKKYKIRKLVWSFVTPIFPSLRYYIRGLHQLRYSGRETYHVGHLKQSVSYDSLENELQKNGFVFYPVAWLEKDEFLSLRKPDGFTHQYHIRIFTDREVRGHHELTPEYKPLKHFFDFGKIDCTKELREMLREFLE